MANTEVADILVVDDDRENLEQLKKLLPPTVGSYDIHWDYCSDFDEALKTLEMRRYDILVSDIYRNREGRHKTPTEGDVVVRKLVSEIRARRFCPIVIFSDGTLPPDLVSDPFVQFADKSAAKFIEELTGQILKMLATGVPQVARHLHNELDRYAGSYLWKFLAENWKTMSKQPAMDAATLERMVRRRAAVQLARIENVTEAPTEREKADPGDYYIYPPIAATLRLGTIIKRKGTDEFRMVLTPHCHLVVQPGTTKPKADYVLTASMTLAKSILESQKWQADKKGVLDQLRKRTGIPSQFGTPDGRYCFLPAFMEIPDLYCDLLRLQSEEYSETQTGFDQLAVLDSPFAEALQACFGRLYSAVGVPNLNPDHVTSLGPSSTA